MDSREPSPQNSVKDFSHLAKRFVEALGQGKPVSLEAELPEDSILVIHSDTSSIEVLEGRPGHLNVEGIVGRRGYVRFTLAEEKERPVGHLYTDSARIKVLTRPSALGVIADSSSVRTYLENHELRYTSVKADASSILVKARIRKGGGLYAWLDSSVLEAKLAPQGAGNYWVDLEVDASGVKIEFVGEKTYILEEAKTETSRITVKTRKEPAETKVKVKIKADSSSIKLL